MEETLGNVGSYLDLAKYPGFLPQCLEELCILQTSNAGFFFLQGVRDYSVPVGLDGKAQVDLVVVGSVAVSEKGEEKNFQQKGPKFQSSVRKVTLRGRDRFVLAAELCSWVLLVCVTNPCSQSQQWPQRCFVLQENSGGKQFFVFKGIQAGSMV